MAKYILGLFRFSFSLDLPKVNLTSIESFRSQSIEVFSAVNLSTLSDEKF